MVFETSPIHRGSFDRPSALRVLRRLRMTVVFHHDSYVDDATQLQFPPMTTTVPVCDDRSLSLLARGLTGSEILRISGEIRTLAESGREICNLTVGDFSPKEFRIPAVLEGLIVEAFAAGETNYPPSDGTKELRQAVIRYYDDVLGLKYPIESTLIAGGARPIIFAAYAAVDDPRDKVVYTIPSWNNT